MKIIDQNGRLFGKISIIDLLVALVVLVLAVALYVRTSHRDITASATNDTAITFQVKVSAARNYIVDDIKVGDQVFDLDREDTGGPLGTITDIDISPGERIIEFYDGTISDHVPVADSVNLLITVEAHGLVDGKRCMINRIYPLGINANRNLCTPYAQFTGIIESIDTDESAS